MQRKHFILLISVAVLVVLNLWRWVPVFTRKQKTTSDVPSSRSITVQSLTVSGNSDASVSVPGEKRNLFFADSPVLAKPRKVHPVAVARALVKPPSRRELERSAAQAELGTYRLVGVVIRQHGRQAFILKGGHPYIGRLGQLIDRNIRIEKITAKEVVLRDSKSRVTRTMRLSGD